jgi:hypothetical protein
VRGGGWERGEGSDGISGSGGYGEAAWFGDAGDVDVEPLAGEELGSVSFAIHLR